MNNEAIFAAYEQIADVYVAQRDQFKSQRYLERFAELVPEGSSILDVGCGGGLPVDGFLIDRGYQVHGIDLSSRMIELALANVPQATYELANMSELQPSQFTVGGIVSLYAIFHTPRERHAELLGTFASFLPSGGAMLISMGASDWEGTDSFHGVDMSWSHFGSEINLDLVSDAGFAVLHAEIDHSSDESHQFIIAVKL